MPSRKRPLEGIRVIELGQLLAGPFTGSMLAYFGAEVIKVEPPKGGDPIRGWREVQNGTSLWWHSLGRNKKSVAIDLKAEEGRELVRQLIDTADVLVENFRPGVMEKWGLGPDAIKKTNPGIIYTRISGYGQDGPNSVKPGYASVCEGYSGFRYVNGFENQAPVRPNLSIGDTIAAIHAALGVTLAIIERSNNENSEGQVIDVALYESMFNLMEAVIPEYDGAGVIREPSGTTVTGIVPTNTYRCRDARYVVIGGNGDAIFKRLMIAAGHPEMAENPEMADNAGRVIHEVDIDNALAKWCLDNDAKTIIDILEAERVPVGPIYNVEDMMNDAHYQARGMFEQVEIDGKPLKIPAILPKLKSTPGATTWSGPQLGSHNDEVLGELLGLSDEQLAELKNNRIIA
ncbi:MAG: CaiB/BaiF CoA-transferase family protein [Oceanicoccus sp.]|uniref:CaiB/BaiF CoA transferase family protein n=1 Tax=Oceanicoccus sp. TaxID=2691044 RepID=UPI002623A786|nr:CaiB/BaiF CoA-transferase family protein [Oceanicoccus sp.]MDG1773626.1 CaiB/BaiF CoA-transferase family protein [Oceanicoccus sp.]